MQRFAIRLILAFTILLTIHQGAVADTYPKREMRAGWIATVWNLDWPKGTDGKAYYDTSSARSTNQKTYLRNMIQNLKATGFNAVNFQVRGMCDAMYKSSYEPWSSALTGTRGKAPSNDWDPLAYCIEVCHELGMECHAWVNPFRFSSSATLPSTTNDMKLRNNGWIITHGSTSVLNPAIEDARNYIVESICKEILLNYDIDGMVWDDYFYPNGIPSTSEAQDYTHYLSYKNAGGTMSIGDWRRNNVNTTVKMAFDMIQREKPYVKFGIAPAGVANEGAKAHGIEPAKIASNGYQYNGIFADPCAWIIDGYIDYISPQLYWPSYHESAPFNPLCEWWNNLGNDYGVQCYISIDIASSVEEWTNSANNYEERLNQIAQVRATSVDFNPGQIFYSAGYLNGPNSSGFGEYLKDNVYQYQAITPKIVRTNEQQLLVNPGKVSNLALNSSTLSWAAVNSSTKHKYAVYAIPLSVGVIDASSTIHTEDGGFKAEYLIDVTYNTSLSGVPTGSYWYAVTAIDRYGYEWEAATLNAPKLGNVSVSLNAPTTGTTLPFGDNTFSWTSDGASFLFQISTSEDFNRPLIEKELTTKNHTLNITPEEFEDEGTYYWRVVASKENYNSAWSEVRSFTIEPRPFIPLTLLSPENNSTIESDKINFEWEGVEGATYTFEIAEFPSFNTIIRTATLTNTNYSLDKSSFSGGKTYFWRIKAVKDGYQPSVSEQASFNTPKVEGETVDGLIIDELWIKSINTNNFPTQLSSCISARTMAAYNGKLYILERASDTECYLLEFDGRTCEFLKQIPLTGDIYSYSGGAISSWDHKAGQCIFSDGNGNLYISCLAIASEVRPLTVCSVNVSTGATSKIFEANKTAVRHRIDYVNATGNLNATGGQIWAATTDNLIYRWTRNSNGTWTEETTTINNYYPNIVTALGTAPYIQPISSTQFIVDGASTHPSLYTFNSGTTASLNSSFADNAAIQPMNALSNGTCSITIGNTPLFVYVDDNHNGSGHSFSIVANKHNFDFSQFQFMKSIPENKLGKVQHDYALDQTVAIKNDDGSATIFLYAPKNGLAAYRISLPEIEISLNSPANNATFEEDFDFSWNGVDGASYTLEISKTATFEDIVFNATTTSTSYNSSNFNFASETQYFWRVKASHPNYTSKNSEVRSFISPQKKSAKDNLIIEERWLYNTSPLGDAAQRSMTAYNGNVYVITNSSGALLEFSGITGAYNRTITLKGDCFTNSSSTKLGIPTNCIFVDGNNNLCVSNLVTSFSTDNPLTVCTIDINTGNTTRVFQSSVTATMRIDYANAFGDVTKEGGQIWGAVSANGTSNHNRIYRWTRNSNGSWTEDYTTIAKFYPTAGNIGGAPWVMPITETDFLVDGSGNAPTLYTFISKGNATYKSGFDSNKSLAPSYTTSGKAFGAGMNQITLGKFPLFIYNNDNFNGNGYNFTIVHNPSNYDFADMEYLWAIPDGYLGTEKHSTVLNSVATIKNEDNSATVFVYAPLNGLAAYRISLPEMNLSLTSPSNNETVEEAFDFKWTGISGSKYTLEVSTSETFDNLEFSEYTEANTYSPTDFKFKGSTKYYWRVTAENNNYTTTTSSVGSFIYPLKSGLKNELYYPNNNAKLNSDIVFICLKPYVLINNERHYADKTILEISKDENFNDILIEFNGNWIEVASKEGIWCYQHTIPISYFANGTYYWRVRAEKDEYNEVISPIRQFIVKDQYDISTEYKMTRETASYPELSFGGNAYISCYNNWIRSSTYGNPISQANGGKYARGFCVRSDKNKDQNGKDIIYMHTDDDDALSLDYYNAANGEYLGTLDLTAAEGTTIAIKTFPCNGLFVDNAGNLCMYNLANTTTSDDVTTYVALQLCTIDVNIEKGTAIVTERFKVDAPIRFDHCHAYGDVANNKFTLFAAGNSTNIYRWTINGTSIKLEVKALASKAFGSNPYLHAVTNELVYIDGNGTNFALYDFENGVYKNQFTENLSKQVGGAVLIHNNATSFAIYPTNGVDNAHTFNISSIESILTGNTSANTRWSIPSEENALPPYNNKNTYYAHVDFLPKVNLENVSKSANINPNSSIIYLYVPGSGLASYSITSHIITGVEDIEAKNIKLGITNQEITFGCDVDNAQIYTLSGILVNSVEEASSIEKPFTQGVYILRITLDGVTSTHKIVLK